MPDSLVGKVEQVIIRAASTKSKGDGKIFISSW
ncbi:MAG: hypothetical protein OEM21_02145 [Nitrosopumilus sp.]|nr:hypothetical protein [Nitrosopumilus sp.]